MKHTCLILLLGLLIGLGVHFSYYRLRVSPANGVEGRLHWMRQELQLTDAQYARIEMLHQASRPYLRELAARVGRMRAEAAAFETARRDNAGVDFVDFARYVEARRKLNEECMASKHRLVQAAVEVMNPQQRTRYLGLVAAVPDQPSLFD
jgi:hypothetical protein